MDELSGDFCGEEFAGGFVLAFGRDAVWSSDAAAGSSDGREEAASTADEATDTSVVCRLSSKLGRLEAGVEAMVTAGLDCPDAKTL